MLVHIRHGLLLLYILLCGVLGLKIDYNGRERSSLQNGIYVLLGTRTLLQDPKDLLPVETPWIWLDEGDVIQFDQLNYNRDNDASLKTNETDSMSICVVSLPQMVDLLDPLSRVPLEMDTTSRVKDPFSPSYLSYQVKPNEKASFGYVIPESQLYFILLVDNKLHVPQSWREQLHLPVLFLNGTVSTGTPASAPAPPGSYYTDIDNVVIVNHLPSHHTNMALALSSLALLSFIIFISITNHGVFAAFAETAVGISNSFIWKRKQPLPRMKSQLSSYNDQLWERYIWSMIFLIRSIYYGLGAYQVDQIAALGSSSTMLSVSIRILSSLEDDWMIAALILLGTSNKHYRSHLNRKELRMFSSLFFLYIYFGLYEAITQDQFIFKRMIQACLVLFLLIFDNLRYYSYRLRLEREALFGDNHVLDDYRIANIYSSFKYVALMYIVKGSVVMSIESLINADSYLSPETRLLDTTDQIAFDDRGPNIIIDNWKMCFLDLMMIYFIILMALDARCFDKKELNPLDSRYSYMIKQPTIHPHERQQHQDSDTYSSVSQPAML